jgi:hypothetical protein
VATSIEPLKIARKLWKHSHVDCLWRLESATRKKAPADSQGFRLALRQLMVCRRVHRHPLKPGECADVSIHDMGPRYHHRLRLFRLTATPCPTESVRLPNPYSGCPRGSTLPAIPPCSRFAGAGLCEIHSKYCTVAST